MDRHKLDGRSLHVDSDQQDCGNDSHRTHEVQDQSHKPGGSDQEVDKSGGHKTSLQLKTQKNVHNLPGCPKRYFIHTL